MAAHGMAAEPGSLPNTPTPWSPTNLETRPHKCQRVADKLCYAAGHHASCQNGCMGWVAIILLQQPVFQQLKQADVHTSIRQDATLQHNAHKQPSSSTGQ